MVKSERAERQSVPTESEVAHQKSRAWLCGNELVNKSERILSVETVCKAYDNRGRETGPRLELCLS